MTQATCPPVLTQLNSSDSVRPSPYPVLGCFLLGRKILLGFIILHLVLKETKLGSDDLQLTGETCSPQAASCHLLLQTVQKGLKRGCKC